MLDSLAEGIKVNGRVVNSTRVNSKEDSRVCKELIGASFYLGEWADLKEAMIARGFSPEFAEADFQDRFYSINPGTAIDLDPTGVLKNHLNDEGRLAYTYGERLFYQWSHLIEYLKKEPYGRQGLMTVWDPYLDIFQLDNKRVPCSIGYQFFIRDFGGKKKLQMIYYIRSCDILGCFPNDIYTASRTIEYIAEAVGAEPSLIVFMVGSLHYFEEKKGGGKDE